MSRASLRLVPWLDAFLHWVQSARHRLIAELLSAFVIVWIGSAVALWALEGGANAKVRGLGDAVYALLVTMTTSGDSAVQPRTEGGQLVMGLAVLLSKLLTTLLCALAAAVLIERKVREDMGMKMHRLDRHILILGWNLKGPQIIHTLRSTPATAHRPVLIAADLEQKPVDDPAVVFSRVQLPLQDEAYARICLARAERVLVLANYSERQHADTLSAVTCLLVRRLNPQATLVAELLDPGKRHFLEAAGVDQVVGIGEIGGFLLGEALVGNEEARVLLASVADGAHRTHRLAAEP